MMKKKILLLAAAGTMAACSETENIVPETTLTVTGYACNEAETRTTFGTPSASEIPYTWTSGDYIWLGNNKSTEIAEDCILAQFQFKGGTAIIGTGHIFYNMTGTNKTAYVLATQTADGNLGNDGDFGYATLDEFNSFYLEHKTAYVWFDTKTNDNDMPKLMSITLAAADNIAIAGKRFYNFSQGKWADEVTDGSSSITLNFDGGYQLKSSNEGIMAAMVVLPAAVKGTTLTITYTFDDESTFTETKNPKNDFSTGGTQRIATTIKKSDLVPNYELRVLTFEDEDKKFEDYSFTGGDGEEYNITTWSELIPEHQWYNGSPLIYYMSSDAEYEWYDEKNTELYHKFPQNYDIYNFAGGGAVVSSHTVELGELEKHTIYDYQVSVTCGGGNNGSSNFCVAYNVSEVDLETAGLTKTTLEFGDGIARVIDHMFVTIAAPTHYCIKYGNDFSKAFDNDDFLKLVATGIREGGSETEPIEILLAEGSDYIITNWTKWDLSGLGKVKAVKFHMEEAQFVTYGEESYYCTPLYFAFDDVAVRFEK